MAFSSETADVTDVRRDEGKRRLGAFFDFALQGYLLPVNSKTEERGENRVMW